MAAIVNLTKCQPQNEKVSDYGTCVFILCSEWCCRVAVFLTAIGGEMYVLLASLLSPAKPRDKTYAEITAVLKHILGPS